MPAAAEEDMEMLPEGAGSDTESDYLNKKGVSVTKRDEEYQELL